MKVLIVIPVYNEAVQLTESIGKLIHFLDTRCRFACEVLIAENGSTDRTFEIAQGLARQHRGLRARHLDEKGRGNALKRAWSETNAEVLSYMDVDLSTDLAAFPQLVEAVASGRFDIATGSRLLPTSSTNRSLKREMISRGYNCLVRALFCTSFSDAQCGFKAITHTAGNELLPLVEDNGWFMDTELMILAEKLGYKICDLPVRWVEDSDSRVKIWNTAVQDVRGLIRLRRRLGLYATNRSVAQGVYRPFHPPSA